LEPLYMGAELRNADGVTSGGDSVLAYVHAQELRAAGDQAGFEAQVAELAQYNRYDCLSTLRLRDWLLAQRDTAVEAAGQVVPPEGGAPAAGVTDGGAGARGVPGTGAAAAAAQTEETPEQQERRELAEALLTHVTAPLGPLLAAALDYHRRENEPYWHDHFERLRSDRAVGDSRDVLEVFYARRREVVEDYGRPRRLLDLAGRFGTGSTVEPGCSPETARPPGWSGSPWPSPRPGRSGG